MLMALTHQAHCNDVVVWVALQGGSRLSRTDLDQSFIEQASAGILLNPDWQTPPFSYLCPSKIPERDVWSKFFVNPGPVVQWIE